MIIIPGQSGTYRHSRGNVTHLLAESGQKNPMPRQPRPPSITDCLNPGETGLENIDAAADEIRLIILRALRNLFPLWDITLCAPNQGMDSKP